MPTISMALVNPSCTPFTALATRARVSPCRARCWPVSSARLKVTAPWFTAQVIPRGRGFARTTFPFSTRTVLPSTRTLTPGGRGIGMRPIRDIASSPYVAHDFAADARLAGIPGAENAFRRGQDAEAQAAHHRRDLVVARVDPAARPADDREA